MGLEATMSKLGGGVDQLEGDLLQSNTLGVDEQRLHKTKHKIYFQRMFETMTERKGVVGILKSVIYSLNCYNGDVSMKTPRQMGNLLLPL